MFVIRLDLPQRVPAPIFIMRTGDRGRDRGRSPARATQSRLPGSSLQADSRQLPPPLTPCPSLDQDMAVVQDGHAMEAPVGRIPPNQLTKANRDQIYAGISYYGVSDIAVLSEVNELKIGHPNGADAAELIRLVLESIVPTVKAGLRAGGYKSRVYVYLDQPMWHRAEAVVGPKGAVRGSGAWLLPHLPSNSPDLNLQEKAWAWLKKDLANEPITTMAAYLDALESVWKGYSLRKLQGLIDRYPAALDSVIESGGVARQKYR